MTEIDLYVDPVCPFAWVTSRWLLAAAEGGPHTVRLRQMSLAVLNDGDDVDADHQPMIERSRRLGRVFAAATDTAGHDAFARLYETLGPRLHVHGDEIDTGVLIDALTDAGLDPALAQCAEDPTLDTELTRTHRASQDALGGSGGSPIIVIDGHGFNGPVLTESPTAQHGPALLDALVTAATTPGFAALHRPYQGPPRIQTTSEDNR
ncbi:mycothiol-dependent nitroreductase Rv2466c family protein [Nocardia mangyaensis]|uniref:mycothiol-dependent nitroreductase Rv2466c family protein n=1 Tax=Nocardia mangyaensis TaxID=2213200 RepID=UPI0026767CD0|nr:disulfide bond formation protein DsbA [Nocardia mangyaensis]MDO3645717.1 disulfide bond formation protein DsbA [Nocardia mangyaensis]